MNTIYDMQNEMDCLSHYNEFVHILDFEIVFWKNDDSLLVLGVLDKIVLLYLIIY